MDLRQRATAGAVWSFAGAWGHRLAVVAVLVILARQLGPEAFGLAGLAMMAVAFAETLLVSGGCSEFLIQKRGLEAAHISAMFWLQLCLGVAAAAICVLAAPLIAAIFARPELVALIRWFAVLLPLSALAAVPDVLLRRAFAFKTLALRSMLAVATGGACGVAMALGGFGVWSLLGYQLSRKSVEVIVLWRFQPVRNLSWPKTGELREIVAFASFSTVSRLFQAIDTIIVRTSAGLAIGATAVGYLQFSRSITDEAANLLINPFTRVAMPAFAEIKGQSLRLARILRLGGETSALMAFPTFLGIAATAPDLIPAVFGEQWAGAVAVVQIFCFAGLTYPIGNLDVALLRGLGHVRLEAAFAVAGTLALVALVVSLARYGVEAIAWTILVTRLVIAPARFIATQISCRIDRTAEAVACGRLLLLALIMAAAVHGWRALPAADLSTLARLISSIAIGAATYCVLIAIFARSHLLRLVDIARRGNLTGRGGGDQG